MRGKGILISLFFCLLSFASMAVSYLPIENLKTLEMKVKEESSFTSRKKEIQYEVSMELPGKYKKTVLAPAMNAGECYLYLGDQKTVYLPIFDSIRTTRIEEEENQIVETIEYIRNQLRQNAAFRKKYYAGKRLSMPWNANLALILDDFKEVDGYFFPCTWQMEEKGKLVLDLRLSDVKCNPQFTAEEFLLP